MLMDKYPFIIYVGAGILGKVGGEMIFTDPVVAERLRIPNRLFMGWKRSLPSASSLSENSGCAGNLIKSPSFFHWSLVAGHCAWYDNGSITRGCYVRSRGEIRCGDCGFTPVAELSGAFDWMPGSILAGWKAFVSP